MILDSLVNHILRVLAEYSLLLSRRTGRLASLEEEEEEEEEEPLLIYTAQGSPFRCKKLSVINGSPERNNVLKLCIHMHYTNTNM